MLNYSIRNYSDLFGTIRNVMLPICDTKKHAVLPVTSNKRAQFNSSVFGAWLRQPEYGA